MSCRVGDVVLYGSDGICRVEEVSERKIGSETFAYYVLKPVYDARSTVLVPLQNQKLLDKMTEMLSEDELYDSIKIAKEKPMDWMEDDTQRKETFREIIDAGYVAGIIGIMMLLYRRRDELVACGRKLRATDEIILKECEKILYDEFAYILGMERESAKGFLAEKLNI